MTTRDIVTGVGCDAGQNAVAQFVNKVDRSAQSKEHISSTSSSSSSSTQLNPYAERANHIFGSGESPSELSERQMDLELDKYMNSLDLGENATQQWNGMNDFFPNVMDDAYDSAFWDGQANFNISTEYVFKRDNPYTEIPNPFDMAVKFFNTGKLAESIKAFEAEVIRHPKSSDAWRWLGTAHAESDDDKMAIAALKKSIEADPQNIEALLDLGVSYTNELVQGQALQYLRDWLLQNPEYCKINGVMQTKKMETKLNHNQVLEMFHAAALIDRNDPDVFTVLGVLYNLSREFDKAEEAFKESLLLDPSNYSLWNKLGATQANSLRADGSKQAVYAYRKALELKPNYVRAWVNMGISYANQQQYDLACKYYLKALSLNQNAEHIWAYLKLSLTCMNKEGLLRFANDRNLDAFRNHFTF